MSTHVRLVHVTLFVALQSIGEEDEDGDENDEQALKRKPWGDSGHFCPVALVDKGVLWPGSQDTAARWMCIILL